jgi:ectoine hydroxylase-related dioxygenase (phytanoyl-CoA dioxygenase family)
VDDHLSLHERYFFDVNGYVVRHDVLSNLEVRVLNAVVESKRLAPPGEDIMSQRFAGLLDWDDPFDLLLDHPSAMGVLRDVIGDRIRLDHAYGIHMRPNTSGLGLHGGATPWDPAQSYVVRNGAIYNGLVGVMWGLSASEPGDGGFCCIPGSHKAAFPCPSDIATFGVHREWVTEVPLPLGTMLVFTEALTHGTFPWRGETDRRSVVYKYAPSHVAWAAGPGWDEGVHGQNPSLGSPTTADAARRAGRRRALLLPPAIAGSISLGQFDR